MAATLLVLHPLAVGGASVAKLPPDCTSELPLLVPSLWLIAAPVQLLLLIPTVLIDAVCQLIEPGTRLCWFSLQSCLCAGTKKPSRCRTSCYTAGLHTAHTLVRSRHVRRLHGGARKGCRDLLRSSTGTSHQISDTSA